MSYRLETEEGILIALGGTSFHPTLMQSYADDKNVKLILINAETGEIIDRIEPIPASSTKILFDRRVVSVRVHDDDRQTILDTAAALNEVRGSQ